MGQVDANGSICVYDKKMLIKLKMAAYEADIIPDHVSYRY